MSTYLDYNFWHGNRPQARDTPMSQDARRETRQDIVAQVARQLGAIISRRVSLAVGVWGEPGIGKTHAAQAILERVPCHHLSLHATTNPQQIAAALPRAKALPGWAQAQLGRLERGESLEPDALARTLAAALERLSPFVLHLEDVHESDAERLELIGSLARALVQTRGVGLLVTSRAELPAPFLNHHLEPLSQAETAELINQELKADAPQDALAWMEARTRGNPLFALEFLRYLRRQGFLWSDGQRWHWREPPQDFVPVTVEALILEMVSSTAGMPEPRAVLEARSILPNHLEPMRLNALLAAATKLEAQALRAARSELERRGLLHGDDFAHPLFGEVVAGALENGAKQALARRIVAASQDADPELAGRFVALAGFEATEALALLKDAVRRAREQGETVKGAYLLSLAAERAEGEERVRLALEAEEGLVPTGDYRRREQLARLALEEEPENRDARHALAHVYALTHRDDEVRALIEALPEAERRETRWVEVLFRALSNTGRYREALALWDEHEAIRSLPGGRSSFYAVYAYSNLGEFSQAEGLIERVLGRPDLHIRTEGLMLDSLAYIRSQQGRLEEAADLYDRCVALAQRDGNLYNLGTAFYDRAINQSRLGRFREAMRDIEEAMRLYEQAGNTAAVAEASVFLGDLALRQGDFERAERVLLEARSALAPFRAGPRLVACEAEIALLYAEWRPSHGGALAWKASRDALEHARALQNPGSSRLALSAAARVAAWREEAEEALQLARKAANLLDPNALDEDAYWCAEALARALEANGRSDEAFEQWTVALRTAQTLRFQLEAHEAELEVARLQHDWERVRVLRDWFREHGLALGVRRADEYLPAPPPSVRESAAPLARINVLGPVTLERDGQGVPTRARKRLEILTYLLETRVSGRAEASVLELVDAIYPGEPEPEAKNALKQQVYLIRSGLGAESLLSTPGGYALGAVTSDAEEFLRSADASLWRGPYLSSFEDGWLPGVREALTLGLRSQVAALLETNAREAARLGAILCEMEPFDADALRLTVGALEAAGEAAEARRAFLRGRARLQEVGESLPEGMDRFVTAS